MLLSIAFGWFVTLGMRFVFPAILPQIKDTFAIDNTAAGLAITAIWASYALMQFPAGVLADRLGGRVLLSLSLVLSGVSLVVVGVTPVFPVFLVACVLFGLGTGLFGTARGIVLSTAFAPNPGRAFGVTLAAGSIGSAALPFLASLLADDLGWRPVVGLPVPLFLAIAAVVWWALPAETGGRDDESDLSLRSVRATLGSALGDRAVVLPVVGSALMLFAYQALTAFLPTYLVQAKALSQQTAGALFAVLFVAGAGFQLAGGSAADRVGSRPVLVVVAVVGALTLAVLPSTNGRVALAVLTVVMASRLAVAPVANAYILDALPDAATGTAWGLLRTMLFLVGSAGSTAVGALSDRGYFDEAFYLLAGLSALAALSFALLPKRSEG